MDYDADLTVILENLTRWNSTFLSMQRGLRLKSLLEIYLLTYGNALLADLLVDKS